MCVYYLFILEHIPAVRHLGFRDGNVCKYGLKSARLSTSKMRKKLLTSDGAVQSILSKTISSLYIDRSYKYIISLDCMCENMLLVQRMDLRATLSDHSLLPVAHR